MIEQIDRAVDPPGKLVFTNISEYSLVDDLSGEALPAPLVTLAKREEISEMYRRQGWVEKTIEECMKETGKPPIPVRWVVSNKGETPPECPYPIGGQTPRGEIRR